VALLEERQNDDEGNALHLALANRIEPQEAELG
jgi:hypothetical protein